MHVLIVGGGIGGLATALSLHAVGIECTVFEQVRELRELGVGINTLPHAIKELAALGLLPALDRAGIRTRELIYANRFGQVVWREAARHRRWLRHAAVLDPSRQAAWRAAGGGARHGSAPTRCAPAAGWFRSRNAGDRYRGAVRAARGGR